MIRYPATIEAVLPRYSRIRPIRVITHKLSCHNHKRNFDIDRLILRGRRVSESSIADASRTFHSNDGLRDPSKFQSHPKETAKLLVSTSSSAFIRLNASFSNLTVNHATHSGHREATRDFHGGQTAMKTLRVAVQES